MGKVKGLSHRDIRIKIIDLQDQHCNGCKYRYKIHQCLEKCEIGKQIRGLGSHLGAFTEAEVKNRKTKEEWDVLCEKAVIMKAQGMTYVKIAKKLGIKDSGYISEQLKKRNLR